MVKLLCVLLNLGVFQAQFVKLKIVSEDNKPIEGVCVQLKNKPFLYSDTSGVVNISKAFNRSDSVFILRLGFKEKHIVLADLKGELSVIHLVSDIKKLDEIVVYNLDLKKYVKKSIDLIPKNYSDIYSPSLVLNANISFFDSDNNRPLIKYNGELILSKDEKGRSVGKKKYTENIVSDVKDYIFRIKPYNFISIIPITSHPVIRKFKKFDFYKYEHVLYKDQESLKIYFRINQKYGGQSGYLIVNDKDRAIMVLSYTINPINDWIVEKTRKSLVKTSLLDYFVEADYEKNDEGLYLFSSGSENIKLTTKVGKQLVNTTSDTHLKRINTTLGVQKKTKLEEIFDK